ncbi:MAG: coenzyme F420-0:L-glutamate ligase [Promethearchaeota archaeon]|jgi:coenzyme F420-0:L-glutamate ligase/coenzyme F420-1:gamma-L-glutamate ligase
MNSKNEFKVIGLEDIPLVKTGDDIPNILLKALQLSGLSLLDGDIMVIAQSLISKCTGRIANLNEITPSKEALELHEKITPKAKKLGLPEKDPKLIQLILNESKELVKSEHVIITETTHGFVCADAGIDKSNVEGDGIVTLLPENPDYEAEKIRKSLKKKTDKDIAVIISDSFGRPFRVGAVGVAIGVSGIDPILDMRGFKDLFGYELQSTIVGQVDSLASAAQLMMGETNEGIPAVLIRGYKFDSTEDVAIKKILREKEFDIFRASQSKVVKRALKNRRSYKFPFSNKEVKREIIEECIEIARWAPSAHNGQFWRYILLENLKVRKELILKMNEKLKNDLRSEDKSEEFIKHKVNKTKGNFLEAPVLILLCLDTTELEKYTDIERSKNEEILGIQSVSSSATYLLLAFEIMNLAACWYCAPLFAKDIIKETLKLPQDFLPMAFFTVGYPSRSVSPPHRKNLDEIIYKLKI